MPSFEYRARDRVGAAITGVLDAPGMDIARLRLGEMGYIPVSLKEGRRKSKAKGEGKGFNITIITDDPLQHGQLRI